ncbi:MAG: hypothetical protein JXQ87_10885 [Bacteroidia bacterium]
MSQLIELRSMNVLLNVALFLLILFLIFILWMVFPRKKEREEKAARLRRLEDETITIPETGEVISFDQIQASNYIELDEVEIISESKGIAKEYLQFYLDFVIEKGLERKDLDQKEINRLNELHILNDYEEFYFSDYYSNNSLTISIVNDEESHLMGVLSQFDVLEWFPQMFKIRKDYESLINLEYEPYKVKEEEHYEYFVLDESAGDIFQDQFIRTLSKIENTYFEIKENKVYMFLMIEHIEDALEKIQVLSKGVRR